MVASRWIVGGLLGKSALASVYEAEEARQSRFVALKLFDPSLAEEPGWSDFVTLTMALAELPGDGIARAYDAGIDPLLGRPYVASERLVFPTLSRYVSERGALGTAAFVESLRTLAGALDTAHAAGVVHGNLKPQNVFISTDNPRWARLTDFCLGRLSSSAHSGPFAMLGWSAPEALAGFPTPASDRYALALLTFFAIVGSPWHSAFRTSSDGRSPDSQRPPRIASERAMTLGGKLDPALDAWFARALSADPSARFGSASEMVQAFAEAAWGGPTVEIAARESLGLFSGGSSPPVDPRAPPVSMPLAGPAYASTLEMPKPDEERLARMGPPPSRSLATASTVRHPKAPLPWVLRVTILVIVALGVGVALWVWLARGSSELTPPAASSSEP
jgi:serine/threonine-protein kinase